MKNIKTTLAGILAGAPIGIDALVTAYNAGYFTGQTGLQLCLGIGLILLGAYTKDKNITGGTVPQTQEAKNRIKE